MTKIYTIFCREQGSDDRPNLFSIATDENQLDFHASRIKECGLELAKIDVYEYDLEVGYWLKDKVWSNYITEAYIKYEKVFKI